MAINFNVVGIFYTNNNFTPTSASPTVKDVMDGVNQIDPLFRYFPITLPNGSLIVNTISVYKRFPFKGRTGIQYPAGNYGMSQTFNPSTAPNPYSVWQYYLFDQTGKRVPVYANTSFAVQKVQDGWSIVWRLVNIRSGPGPVTPRLREMLTDEEQKELGMV